MTVVGLALGVMGLTGSLAFAQTEDSRGERVEGNASTCDQAGLSGEMLEPDSDFTFTGGDGQYVSITGLADGVSVSGIVVKGGPAYNVYEPGERGLPEETPWEDLRSPLNRSGNIPDISHWFVCGTTQAEPPADPPIVPPFDPPVVPPLDPPVDPGDGKDDDKGHDKDDDKDDDKGHDKDDDKGHDKDDDKGHDKSDGKGTGDDECPATEPCPQHDPRTQHDEGTSGGLLPPLGI